MDSSHLQSPADKVGRWQEILCKLLRLEELPIDYMASADIILAIRQLQVSPKGQRWHGRNDDARRAIFEFLRSINLHPLEWSEVVQERTAHQ